MKSSTRFTQLLFAKTDKLIQGEGHAIRLALAGREMQSNKPYKHIAKKLGLDNDLLESWALITSRAAWHTTPATEREKLFIIVIEYWSKAAMTDMLKRGACAITDSNRSRAFKSGSSSQRRVNMAVAGNQKRLGQSKKV